MIEQLQNAAALKTELDSYRPLNPEAEGRIMQKFRLDWNYHSNHLEGNQLTYGETKALLLFGITAQGKPLKDHIEITGHNEAIELLTDVVKEERPLIESLIRELHILLLKKPYYVNAITPNGSPTRKLINIGSYKETSNHVETITGEIFYFATPEETPAKMMDLMNWYRQQKDEPRVNPIALAAEFHYKFILIHPFDDGNGRMARLLMNLILMQFGYPPVIIRTDDKANYISVLRLADAGNIEPFIEYIARNLINSLQLMLRGARGESVDEPDDLDKELALLDQRIKGVGQTSPSVKTSEALLELSKHSYDLLLIEFIMSCRKFNQFYESIQASILFKGEFINTDLNLDTKISELINVNHREVRLLYNYKGFKRPGFLPFNHTSSVHIHLGSTNYGVELAGMAMLNPIPNKLMKNYSTQLTEDERKLIVDAVAKNHQYVIKSELEKLEKEQKMRGESE